MTGPKLAYTHINCSRKSRCLWNCLHSSQQSRLQLWACN